MQWMVTDRFSENDLRNNQGHPSWSI